MGKPNVTEELEKLIDATSLLDVLTGLELICAEKAEHIRHNWQDRITARAWDRVAGHIGHAARDDRVAAVS